MHIGSCGRLHHPLGGHPVGAARPAGLDIAAQPQLPSRRSGSVT